MLAAPSDRAGCIPNDFMSNLSLKDDEAKLISYESAHPGPDAAETPPEGRNRFKKALETQSGHYSLLRIASASPGRRCPRRYSFCESVQ